MSKPFRKTVEERIKRDPEFKKALEKEMSHKVTIELEFEPVNGENDEQQTVFKHDVYNYLEQLIADDTLDYTVTAADYTYGKIGVEE